MLNQTSDKPLTILDISEMKQKAEKIVCLTAYDASFAAIIDKVGIEVILVGDSLGMVCQGQKTTLPVTIRDMVYHSQCVTRGSKRALIIADLPFMTCSNSDLAASNAAQLIQQGGAHMVKLEGARLDCISFLVEQGISVCGHLGLLPQSIYQLGGYRVQGKLPKDAEKILEQALQIQEAGAALLILECVPASLAKNITSELTIPVIGIGAGVDTDGQILVLYDMLNIGISRRPKFSKDFMVNKDDIESAIEAYYQAVKNAEFPAIEHSFL